MHDPTYYVETAIKKILHRHQGLLPGSLQWFLVFLKINYNSMKNVNRLLYKKQYNKKQNYDDPGRRMVRWSAYSVFNRVLIT